MIVVADTSPLIGLIKIGFVEILPAMFGSVVIPSRVATELRSPNRAPDVQTFVNAMPSWLSIESPTEVESISELDPANAKPSPLRSN